MGVIFPWGAVGVYRRAEVGGRDGAARLRPRVGFGSPTSAGFGSSRRHPSRPLPPADHGRTARSDRSGPQRHRRGGVRRKQAQLPAPSRPRRGQRIVTVLAGRSTLAEPPSTPSTLTEPPRERRTLLDRARAEEARHRPAWAGRGSVRASSSEAEAPERPRARTMCVGEDEQPGPNPTSARPPRSGSTHSADAVTSTEITGSTSANRCTRTSCAPTERIGSSMWTSCRSTRTPV